MQDKEAFIQSLKRGGKKIHVAEGLADLVVCHGPGVASAFTRRGGMKHALSRCFAVPSFPGIILSRA
jgi:hypothetical protein